ncbi:VOC family protein [Actinocorallia sp. A-T 12471]|uniref:VOC family protein n=1 Tax=Actinocorallia sp. A-T 12471 TaxID=3089813 RepID=UPI0029CC7128|nr:VOC family protein [Actinocorallia sp. A-T 12471]MDX6741543.1 VOC family protein [Actinocorallia sp. A-T 12471]
MTDRHLITHLRHVDIAMPDLDAQLTFYRDLWGLTEVAADSGVRFLAAEGSPEQYVVRLRRDRLKRLDLVAFGAASVADVDALAGGLVKNGVRMVREPGPLDTPGGGYGVRFFDGDGRVVEVSADVAVRAHRRIEARESIPVRLSHVVINSPAPQATVDWYVRNLGFRLSDTLVLGDRGPFMYFLRCNPQHHSFAVARAPHASFHHASFEMRGLDEYMRGTGRMLRHKVEKVWGPGRHYAGDNTFSYFLDPAGNTVEYTTELELLDEDTWHPHVYDMLANEDVIDQWGTANPMNEAVAARQFNDPDHCLFQAPPI